MEMDRCIVLGTAPCMWDDLRGLLSHGASWDVIAVNNAGAIYLNPIVAWVSLHADSLEKLVLLREKAGGNMDATVWGWVTPGHEARLPHVTPWTLGWVEGTSSMMGLRAAMYMGYQRIVLCGVPLDDTGCLREDRNLPVSFHSVGGYSRFRDSWVPQKHLIRHCARSMSGWTQEFLGAPPASWFKP